MDSSRATSVTTVTVIDAMREAGFVCLMTTPVPAPKYYKADRMVFGSPGHNLLVVMREPEQEGYHRLDCWILVSAPSQLIGTVPAELQAYSEVRVSGAEYLDDPFHPATGHPHRRIGHQYYLLPRSPSGSALSVNEWATGIARACDWLIERLQPVLQFAALPVGLFSPSKDPLGFWEHGYPQQALERLSEVVAGPIYFSQLASRRVLWPRPAPSG